ncbi:MAG: sigma-70 family RNA polymerase sigma factor [Micromonosporaceae bacterium]|nr:sigma-70 family RNA polymerase sigma factor [Micromonosporaceae bacterium]
MAGEATAARLGAGGLTGRPGADGLTAAVHAAQDGDPEAFQIIYRSVQPDLLRILGPLVAWDAEDVASEAWLQIARDLRAFQGDGEAFRGWAATICRNRATDHLRQQRRRPAQPAADEAFAGLIAEQDTARDALSSLSTEQIVALIAKLPPDQAEAVWLRVVMGLDVATVAGLLGKRTGAVRTAAHRGLRRLARLVEPAEKPH